MFFQISGIFFAFDVKAEIIKQINPKKLIDDLGL
jgi:hypothetical protein